MPYENTTEPSQTGDAKQESNYPKQNGQVCSVSFKLDNDIAASEVLERIASLGLEITHFSINPNIDYGYPY